MGLPSLLVQVGRLIVGSTIPWADGPVWGAPFHGQMHTGRQARVLAHWLYTRSGCVVQLRWFNWFSPAQCAPAVPLPREVLLSNGWCYRTLDMVGPTVQGEEHSSGLDASARALPHIRLESRAGCPDPEGKMTSIPWTLTT